MSRFTGSTERLFASLVAVGVIDHDAQLSWFVAHVVPAQAEAVEAFFGVLRNLALTLAVEEKLCGGVVGIAIDGSHLSATALLSFRRRTTLVAPSPVRQQVDGVLLLVPVRAVEEVAVFGQSGEVADAEVAAA